MADTQVLGTCVFGRAGSSPASRTLVMSPDIEDRCLSLGAKGIYEHRALAQYSRSYDGTLRSFLTPSGYIGVL